MYKFHVYNKNNKLSSVFEHEDKEIAYLDAVDEAAEINGSCKEFLLPNPIFLFEPAVIKLR